MRTDVPVKTKAANIINYTKDQVSPLLATLSDLLVKKKAEAEAAYVPSFSLSVQRITKTRH